jgi:phage terminase small subunit
MKNFCHAYARTCNATQAYLEAYDTQSEENAQRQGSRLLQRDDISEYLKEINQPTVNIIVNERERKRKIIWNRIERCVEREDDAAVARYMDILNKMDSEYVNINRNVEDTSKTLAGLDNEQLRQLLDSKTDEEST